MRINRFFLFKKNFSQLVFSKLKTFSISKLQTTTFLSFFLTIANTFALTPTSPTLSNTGSSTQIAFNNSSINDNTPLFRASATHSTTFNLFYIEINTSSAFSGTAYTESFSNTYSSGTQYDLECNSLSSALPTTDGVTYYVRLKASEDNGSSWSSWSIGTYSFTYRTSGSTAWMQTATAQFQNNTLSNCSGTSDNIGGITTTAIVQEQIQASTSDGFDYSLLPGSSSNVSANIRMGYRNTGGYGAATAGLRYTTVPVPKDATIISSTLSFKCYLSYSGTVALRIKGAAYDNVAAFGTPSSYTKTTAYSDWSGATINSWTMDTWYTSPDIKTSVQEIVNRASWASNNSMGFIISNNGSTGDNNQQFYSYDAGGGSSTNTVKLNITYAPKATSTSTMIDFSSFNGATTWKELTFNDEETGSNVIYQVFYDVAGTPTIIPNVDLAGNSAGFGTSPINLSGLNTTTYSKLYIKATLTYTSQSPQINDWAVSCFYGNAESDITEAGFDEPDNIAYSSYQTASGLTTSNAIKVGSFTIRDGGSDLTDADNKTTDLTDITFTVLNPSNIRALAIFDGTTNISETTSVTASTLFNNLSGLSAIDNSSKTVDLYATFVSSVSDNQQIRFTIASATGNPSGSTFAASDAGGAVTSIAGNDNKIMVDASQLVFSVLPSSTIAAGITFSVTISAKDATGSVDTDASGTVTLSENGSGSLSSVLDADLTSSFSSGVISWTDLKYNAVSSNVVITATHSGSYTLANSSGTNFINKYTVGASGADYTSLQSAYNAVKAINPLPTSFIIELQSDYTDAAESYPITLDANHATSSNTITIRPASDVASALVLDGVPAAWEPIIRFSGSNYVIIDGRPGGSGNNKYITIKNTTNPSVGSAGPAVEFKSDASSDTIKYSNLEAESELNTVGSNGVVYFASCTSTCSDNIGVVYNNIGDLTSGGTAAFPISAVYVDADATNSTDNLYIWKNIMYDCLNDNSYVGYFVTEGITSNLILKQNMIYRSSTLSYSITSNSGAVLNFRGTPTNPTITGNFIGGNDADSTDADNFAVTGVSDFYIVNFNAAISGTALIQNNNFCGLSLTNTEDAIIVNAAQSGGTYNITRNRFSAITLDGSAVFGNANIIKVSNGTASVTYNTIGSTSSNNIVFQGNCDGSAILHSNANDGTISNNTIQQIYASNAGTSNEFIAIKAASTGAVTIASNTIQDITSNTTHNGFIGVGSSDDLTGIWINNSTTTINQISKNTIKNLKINSTANNPCMKGIHLHGSTINTAKIEKNFISGFINLSTSSSSGIAGIEVGPDAGYSRATNPDLIANVENNVIILDNKDGSNIYGNNLYGIYTYLAGSDGDADEIYVYHNTVKLTGTINAGSLDQASACFYSNNGAIVDHFIKNNIFQNRRSSTNDNHRAMVFYDNTNYTSNYNYFDVANTNKVVNNYIFSGGWTHTNYTLGNWQASSGTPDANSKDGGVDGTLTIDASGYVTAPTDWTGKDAGTNLLATVPQDKVDAARDATPWIGALESNVGLPVELIFFNGDAKNNEVFLRWATASETNSDYFLIERSTDLENFEPIGTYKAAGFSNLFLNYFAVDENPIIGTNYYRLTQFDLDGKYYVYPTIAVIFKKTENSTNFDFLLFPNPTEDKTFFIQHEKVEKSIAFQIFNQMGMLVFSSNLNTDFSTKVELPNDFKAGMYFVRINENSKKIIIH